jgi:hypothetical protein
MTRQTRRRVTLLVLSVGIFAAVVVAWVEYQQARAGYDAYRERIQPGVRIAGVDVGWHTARQAEEKVWQWVAEPYYRDFVLHYQEQTLTLSPAEDLGFAIPVEALVDEAEAASHQYDYWDGFLLWIQDEAATLDLEVPLQMTWDHSAAARFLSEVAQARDISTIEPMVDVQSLTFYPGRPGRRLEVESSAALINEQVPHPEQRAVTLPVEIVEPDHNPRRIESMLSTLGPVMERAPSPPSYYTATVPISTTGGIEGTPTVSHTGELTWTFPHLVSYTGHLTTTYGFFFDPGQPGNTFDVDEAVREVQTALQAGQTEPITFEPDLVPPPPITPSLLIPPLEARLSEFPGVTSLLVKDLDAGEVIYESNVDYVLSGMSIVKIGIMVEVYRFYGGEVDPQTHQELLDMLGSESCNPCANRLLAAIGGGSSYDGAARVTNTMRRLGLDNYYLCAPFRVEARHNNPQLPYALAEPPNRSLCAPAVWVANPSFGITDSRSAPFSLQTGTGLTTFVSRAAVLELSQATTPRYDRCVRATPREMANLLEMIHACTQDTGLLREAYPNIFGPQECHDMIEIMAANDLRNLLGAGIPADVKLAHKHGFAGYGVSWGDTRGEVGIVFPRTSRTKGTGTTWLISFYIWQDTPWIDFGVNQPLFRDVSNMLYNYFNPESPYWPLPPWAPPPEEEDTSGNGTM